MTGTGYHYTSGMAKLCRAVAEMLSSGVEGRVVLTQQFELVAGPAKATEAKNAFLGWYGRLGKIVDGANKSQFGVEHYIIYNETPLAVAGYLSDFAKVVDQIVAQAIHLNRSADALSVHGWKQGAAGNQHEGMCLYGAIEYPLLSSGVSIATQWETWYNALALVRDRLGTSRLAEWNDAPGRTQADVVQLLRHCATSVVIVP